MQNSDMKIIEIFTSLQGEGLTSGYPTVFIRLAGCNLSCSYCDTPESREGGWNITIDQLCEKVIHEKPWHVCITGGEPLLQLDEVIILANKLIKAGKHVNIETNGTIPFNTLPHEVSVCMDVKCPSSGEKSDVSLLQNLKPSDAVKFVVGTEEDLLYAHRIFREHQIEAEIFISPVYGTNYQQIASYILMHNLEVRMQLQLHKFIGIP